jgi:CTP:molybdopterin cytidylyltransferase MocA
MPASLVLLAAGLGRRFGGPKQLEPVGPSGETVMDYTVFDALRAGVDRVVLVVREELEMQIAMHARRWPAEVRLVRQETPRSRPWGTAHAVLCAAPELDAAFIVANADDFYGRTTIARLAQAIAREDDCNYVVAFPLRETVSGHGSVMRGVLRLSGDGLVRSVEETSIPADPREIGLTGAELASMNAWGFRPRILDALAEGFERFAGGHAGDEEEFRLPDAVDSLLPHLPVRVVRGAGVWAGITHADDLDSARRVVERLVEADEYPRSLWTI